MISGVITARLWLLMSQVLRHELCASVSLVIALTPAQEVPVGRSYSDRIYADSSSPRENSMQIQVAITRAQGEPFEWQPVGSLGVSAIVGVKPELRIGQ